VKTYATREDAVKPDKPFFFSELSPLININRFIENYISGTPFAQQGGETCN
jgi:hypothetical protein